MLYYHICGGFFVEHIKRKRRKTASFPLSILGGILGGWSSGILLVFLFSFIAFRGEDPAAYLPLWGLISLGVGAFICGGLAAHLWGHTSLIPSLLSGAIFAISIVGMGLCIPGTSLPLSLRLWSLPAMLLLSMVGGFLGGRKKGHKRAR
jgi:hypothetical protein